MYKLDTLLIFRVRCKHQCSKFLIHSISSEVKAWGIIVKKSFRESNKESNNESKTSFFRRRYSSENSSFNHFLKYFIPHFFWCYVHGWKQTAKLHLSCHRIWPFLCRSSCLQLYTHKGLDVSEVSKRKWKCYQSIRLQKIRRKPYYSICDFYDLHGQNFS